MVLSWVLSSLIWFLAYKIFLFFFFVYFPFTCFNFYVFNFLLGCNMVGFGKIKARIENEGTGKYAVGPSWLMWCVSRAHTLVNYLCLMLFTFFNCRSSEFQVSVYRILIASNCCLDDFDTFIYFNSHFYVIFDQGV